MFGLAVTGLTANLQRVRNLPRQVRFAASKALNETAYAARADMTAGMQVFDRPTPFIQKSIWVGKTAKPESLEAWVYPRDPGGKAVDPANVLRAEVFGGERKAKRSELAFRRVGILLPGYAMVPSKWLLASPKADQYGNVKGSFLVQLLSYFQAFGEQGYRANMTAKRKAQLAKVRRSKAGFLQTTGVQYFVSYGRGTRATRHTNGAGQLSRPEGQAQTLPAGIWQRSGTHGSDLKPVFLFVREPRYQARLPLPSIFRATGMREFPRRYSQALAGALATAR